MLALVVLASAEEEEKKAAGETVAVEDSNGEESKAEALTEKKQEKRGIHEYGNWHGTEEKTLTIVKKIPVPVPHVKTVHVPHVKEVHVPVKVGVPKPYPVIKHV